MITCLANTQPFNRQFQYAAGPAWLQQELLFQHTGSQRIWNHWQHYQASTKCNAGSLTLCTSAKLIVPTRQNEIAEQLLGLLTLWTHFQLLLLRLWRHHNLLLGTPGWCVPLQADMHCILRLLAYLHHFCLMVLTVQRFPSKLSKLGVHLVCFIHNKLLVLGRHIYWWSH